MNCIGMNKKWILLVFAFVFIDASFAQIKSLQDSISWIHRDARIDGIFGVGTFRAYNKLGNKKIEPVIVAVLDSGVDTDHETLTGRIWVNEDEIAGNGIDDDNNGYIDDRHGWSFLGSEKGDVKEDQHELTREYVRYKKRYESFSTDTLDLENNEDYQYWKKVKRNFENRYNETMKSFSFYSGLSQNLQFFDSLFQRELSTDIISNATLKDIQDIDSIHVFGKSILQYAFEVTQQKYTIPQIVNELNVTAKYYKEVLDMTYNVDFDARSIVGDDYLNPWERNYGNNHIKGPLSEHGTSVASLIVNNKNKKAKMNGIAPNAVIMPVRVVPGGDERDKDVANGIFYAVNNGAKIINLSFGKSFTAYKAVVDSAVRYAEAKGVLIIHAAGNESKNRDQTNRYPISTYNNGGKASNWIEVGANSAIKDENFIGSFSNYGKNTVDFLAPGVRVFTALPENRYGFNDGTSLSAPIVSGIAALVWGIYPKLSYQELIDAMLASIKKQEVHVLIPGSKEDRANLDSLIKTGGNINLYDLINYLEQKK